MHEISIAMSIVDLAEEEVARRGPMHVTAIHLKLGALSGVVKEALLSSFEMACEDTPLRGARLVVEEVPIVVYCPTCKARRPVAFMQWFACPQCGTPTAEVLQGKELEVVALEIDA
jgi:hydrogenase nickel incorporation protein HypA/HybF